MNILMEEEPVTAYVFYFKIAYTNKTYNWSFRLNTTIGEFIRDVKAELENENIEIVEMGQFRNVNGRDAELAPPINYPLNATLTEIFGSRWKKTGFYIRLLRNT